MQRNRGWQDKDEAFVCICGPGRAGPTAPRIRRSPEASRTVRRDRKPRYSQIHRSMNRSPLLRLLCFILLSLACASAKEPADYGRNPEVGKYAEINGIKLYYETYGEGKPLLLIHPNGGNITSMAPQIAEFSPRYRVIAPDNRGHGLSGLGEGRLTYPQMADDIARLLDSLDVKSANVIGWSDGGIVGLLLAIHHPEKVGRLAVMGANLNPAGAYDWAQAWVAEQVRETEAMLGKGENDEMLRLQLQHLDLLGKQPDIPLADLKKIRCPVLVMSGDRDVIRTAHTVEIFENIPKSQLLIFPGATHGVSDQDPKRFNEAVDRFLTAPFKMPDTKAMFR